IREDDKADVEVRHAASVRERALPHKDQIVIRAAAHAPARLAIESFGARPRLRRQPHSTATASIKTAQARSNNARPMPRPSYARSTQSAKMLPSLGSAAENPTILPSSSQTKMPGLSTNQAT